MILDVNASTIWPGSVVQGASLRQVGLTQISLSRNPITVMISNVRARVENGTPKPLSTTVEKPNAATVNEAVSQLLQNIDSKSTTPQVAFNQVEFTSAEQAFTKIGTSISAVVADVRAQLQSDEYAHRNNRMIDFSQRYFTLSVIPEGNPSAYFGDDVVLDDVKAVTSVDNPPVYVTDIAYGRRLLLLFSSTASAEDLRVALNTTFSVAVVSGDLNVSVATKAVFAKTDLRGIVFGGEGTLVQPDV